LKKHFRPTLQGMVCTTLDCVIRVIHRNVDLKHFFIYLNFCYYR